MTLDFSIAFTTEQLAALSVHAAQAGQSVSDYVAAQAVAHADGLAQALSTARNAAIVAAAAPLSFEDRAALIPDVLALINAKRTAAGLDPVS